LFILDPKDGLINMAFDGAKVATGWTLGNGPADGLDMLVIEKPVKSGRLNIDPNDQIIMYWTPRGDLGKQYRKK
jgi:hypothetical protein